MSNPDSSDIETSKKWFDKALAYDNAKNYKKAIECYDKSTNLNPKYHSAWHNKGLAYDSLKNYKKSKTAWLQNTLLPIHTADIPICFQVCNPKTCYQHIVWNLVWFLLLLESKAENSVPLPKINGF